MHTDKVSNCPHVVCVRAAEADLKARHALFRWRQKSRHLRADAAEFRRFGFQEDTGDPGSVGITADEPSVEEMLAAVKQANERSEVAEDARFLSWD